MRALLLSPFLLLSQMLYPQAASPAIETKTSYIAKASLEELALCYDAFLLDAYGVFWGSKDVGVLPGAADAMKYLVSCGKQVGILSNATQLAANERAKLAKHGLYENVHYHFLLTSGELARECFLAESLPFPAPRLTYWMFGKAHPQYSSHLQLFEGTRYREVTTIEEADFIYIAIPNIDGVDQVDPEAFREEVQKVAGKTPVLCVNPDRFGLEGSPPVAVVRQGSIAALFAEAGHPVYYVGKPSQVIFEAALQRFSAPVAKEKTLMIGDTPETDIRGAHQVGISAALVTKTGVLSQAIESRGASSVLEQLPNKDRPDHLLDRLGLEQSTTRL